MNVFCGKAESIKQAIALFQRHCVELWLELNLAKCKLFRPGISEFSPSEYDVLPKVPLSEGSIILGVPVGSDSFIEKALEDTVKKLECILAKIGQLKSNLVKFLLLRACFGASRVNHLLRSLEFRHGKAIASKSSAMFRRGLAEAVGRSGSSELPDINYSLACLPGRRGGLGFKNPDFVHGTAFLASNLRYAREEEVEASFWHEIRDANRHKRVMMQPAPLALPSRGINLDEQSIYFGPARYH